jgi:hypothetical protein
VPRYAERHPGPVSRRLRISLRSCGLLAVIKRSSESEGVRSRRVEPKKERPDQTFAKCRDQFGSRPGQGRTIASREARGYVLQAILILLALLGVAYAAGYYTRDYISRRRHANARLWKKHVEPDGPRPANANQAPHQETHGDLGQMLNRWEDRARARRSHR